EHGSSRVRLHFQCGSQAKKSESDPCFLQVGRCILHVVGSAVAFASTFASLFQPRPLSSTSYFVFFDSVDTYSGCSSWWLSARISTSPTGVGMFMPSSAFATFTGSFEPAFFAAAANMSHIAFAR